MTMVGRKGRRLAVSMGVIIVMLNWGGELVAQQKPAQSDLVERVESVLVQMDISVIDPKEDSRQSIPGLTLEHFDIRLDGKKLTQEQRAGVTVDPICGPDVPIDRPVIAVVDFNFIDAAGRERVAKAFESLADSPNALEEVFKVYILTRQMRRITEGFTRDPAQLREVASLIRSVDYRGDAGMLVAQNGVMRPRKSVNEVNACSG